MSMTGRRRDPDPVDRYVGARIRERRVALALTQAELARALNLTEQQVRRMERGSSRLATRQLLVLADRMAVGIGYFLDGAPARPRAATSRPIRTRGWRAAPRANTSPIASDARPPR